MALGWDEIDVFPVLAHTHFQVFVVSAQDPRHAGGQQCRLGDGAAVDDALVGVVEQQADGRAKLQVLRQMGCYLCRPLTCQGWRSSKLRRSQC